MSYLRTLPPIRKLTGLFSRSEYHHPPSGHRSSRKDCQKSARFTRNLSLWSFFPLVSLAFCSSDPIRSDREALGRGTYSPSSRCGRLECLCRAKPTLRLFRGLPFEFARLSWPGTAQNLFIAVKQLYDTLDFRLSLFYQQYQLGWIDEPSQEGRNPEMIGFYSVRI